VFNLPDIPAFSIMMIGCFTGRKCAVAGHKCESGSDEYQQNDCFHSGIYLAENGRAEKIVCRKRGLGKIYKKNDTIYRGFRRCKVREQSILYYGGLIRI